jgi:2-haloacid dehalogenase
MKKHYPWLFFDADGTLFDYERAETTAFQNAIRAAGIAYEDAYLGIYRRINAGLWQALERGEITPAVLPVRRFGLLQEALQLSFSPEWMSAAYLEQLALQTDLIDGALDVLHTLRSVSRIAILTNGLKAVQRSRLARCALCDYISDLIISEEIGAAKPDTAYFAAAFERLGNPPKGDVLLIGDSLSSDMRGGVDFGLDTCWFNPGGATRPADMAITYEIARLRELLEIVG